MIYSIDTDDEALSLRVGFNDVTIGELSSENKLIFYTSDNISATAIIGVEIEELLMGWFYFVLEDEESAQRFYKVIKHLLSLQDDYKIEFKDKTTVKNKF